MRRHRAPDLAFVTRNWFPFPGRQGSGSWDARPERPWRTRTGQEVDLWAEDAPGTWSVSVHFIN